jgi:hypothetical protein
MGNPFEKEPAIIGAAVVAVLNALVLLGVVSLTPEQIAGINIALVAVLGLFVRQSVFSQETTKRLVQRAAATGDTDIGNPPKG